MSDEATPRLGFPYLATGQAQKELTHNHALARADILIQPIVQSATLSSPPMSLNIGDCWIVGAGATGDWAAHEQMIACWSSGGWIFIPPREGMTFWSLESDTFVQMTATGWVSGIMKAGSIKIGGVQVIGPQMGAQPDPVGGAVVDAEARIAVGQILVALRTHGLIAA